MSVIAATGVGAKRAGRCAQHDDLAWLYDDGSIGCMWEAVTETYASDCLWEPMPEGWITA